MQRGKRRGQVTWSVQTHKHGKEEAMKLTLAQIVKAFIRDCYRKSAQKELRWFKEQPSFAEALENAALAKNCCGKRFAHQRRMQEKALKEAKDGLQKKTHQLKKSKNFDELLVCIEQAIKPIYGLNEVYCYDTAFRLGAYLGHLPTKVYLHAGTRIGAKKIVDVGPKARAVEIRNLPSELTKHLKPYEIEDFLCIFKDHLGKGRKRSKKLPSCLRCTTKLIHHKIPE